MKFGKAYSEATSIHRNEAINAYKEENVNPNPTSPAEDATSAQERINWLSSSVTSTFLKELGLQIEESINEAVKLSISYSSHQNPYRIIQLLNKAYELKQILKKYGRNSSN